MTKAGKWVRAILRGIVDGIPGAAQVATMMDEAGAREQQGAPPVPVIVQVVRLLVALSVVLVMAWMLHRGLIPADDVFRAIKQLMRLLLGSAWP